VLGPFCEGRYGPALVVGVTRRCACRWNLRWPARAHDGASGPGPARRCCPGWAAGAGLGDQAELAGVGDGLGAVGGAELAEQVADGLFDCVEGNYQLLGDAQIGRSQPAARAPPAHRRSAARPGPAPPGRRFALGPVWRRTPAAPGQAAEFDAAGGGPLSRRGSRGIPSAARICQAVCAGTGSPPTVPAAKEHLLPQFPGGFARSFRAGTGLGEQAQLPGKQQRGHLVHAPRPSPGHASSADPLSEPAAHPGGTVAPAGRLRKIPPAWAPSGDAHGTRWFVLSLQDQPQRRPGPARPSTSAAQTRGAQCVPTGPRARQLTARTAAPPALSPFTLSRGGACCATA
jgi:hypothetical protein